MEGMKKLIAIPFIKPDMIFVDLNMPLVDGRQFLIQIKKNPSFKNIPVIVYSTTFDELEAKKLIALGASHFLKKPTSYEALKKQLQPLIKTYSHC